MNAAVQFRAKGADDKRRYVPIFVGRQDGTELPYCVFDTQTGERFDFTSDRAANVLNAHSHEAASRCPVCGVRTGYAGDGAPCGECLEAAQ